MNPLMEQLQDIEGLDPISHWPLAPGWYLVIGAISFAGIFLGYCLYSRYAFKRSWKCDAMNQLNQLEKNLSDTTLIETAVALSTMIRQIAMLRFSRKACAGLAGLSWLRWLKEHDPRGFDWEIKGRPLITAPYAPRDVCTSTDITEIIQAVRGWIK